MSIRAFSIQKKEHLWEFSLASFGKWKNSWDEERDDENSEKEEWFNTIKELAGEFRIC